MAAMQRLRTFHDGQFGSKIKNAKNTHSTRTLDLFDANKGFKKQLIFEK